MITATQVGRDLHLTVEGIEAPFVIHPLPGLAGIQITATFIDNAGGADRAADVAAAVMIALDGAVLDEASGRWVPLPAAEQINYRRLGMELSQTESETVSMPAFFWQTILGIDGVNAYIEGGGGTAGTVKAFGALSQRLGLWTRLTSPNLVSASPTRAASSPSTSTRKGGAKPGKKPQDKRAKKRG